MAAAMRPRSVVTALGLVALAACRPPGYGHSGDPDAATDGTTGDGGGDAGTDGTAAATCSHMFRLDGHGQAASVWLTGDFVAWGVDTSHGAEALVHGIDGGWTGTHVFDVGTYQYKFIVDGTQWIPDPTNQNTVDDGVGGVNSVYVCSQ